MLLIIDFEIIATATLITIAAGIGIWALEKVWRPVINVWNEHNK